MTIRARHVLGLAGISAVSGISAASVATLTVGPPAQAAARPSVPVAASSSPAARTYLAIVGPANKAIIVFADKSKSWTPHTTSSQAEADARPAIRALDLVRVQLQADRWPAQARVGIRALQTDLVPMVHDLQALDRVDMRDPSSWLTTFEGHETTVAVQGRIVRHALQLPPA